MKHYFLIFGCFFLMTNVSFGQDESRQYIAYPTEFQISLNRTLPDLEGNTGRFGLGLGAYYAFWKEKRFNLTLGLEYNYTNVFKKRFQPMKNYPPYINATYSIHAISVPIGFRSNLGKNKRFFIDVGLFADIVFNSYINADEAISRKVRLSNTAGAHIGFGFRIPVGNYELIIKPDCKLAFNSSYSWQQHIYNSYFRLNVGIRI